MGAVMCASAATPNNWKVKKLTNTAKGEVVSRVAAPGTTSKTYTVTRIKTNEPAPAGYSNVTLAAGDVWEDGSGYQMLLDADATAYGTIIPATGALTSGGDVSDDVYAQFEYKIPENADGALNTQYFIMNSEATIQIPAGVYDYCITNPTVGDRMWIAANNGDFAGRGDDYVFESGVSYIITMQLVGTGDGAFVEIDDPSAPGVPTDLTVEPAATYADVTWTAAQNNDAFNLRYRVVIDPVEVNRYITLPDENSLDEQLEGVLIYDADGDGNNWGFTYSDDSQTDVCFYSSSYENYQSLNPDNWLIIPAKLGGTLKFKARNQSSSYLDVLGVYVSTNPEIDTLDDFVQVGTDFAPEAGTEFTQYEFDLSAYEGIGYVALRHYNSYDQYALFVDDIEIIVPENIDAPEWTEVNGVTSPYTINGLTAETDYEVQVQGVKNTETRAIKTSKWSASTQFTTLAEDPLTGIVDLTVAPRAAQRYNVMGQPVGKDYKGIVIENGKKYIVK